MYEPSRNIKRWLLPVLVLLSSGIISIALIVPNLRAGEETDVILATQQASPTSTTLRTQLPATSLSPTPTHTGTIVSSTINISPTQEANCTYTKNYWYNNPGAWLVSNIQLENRSYSQVEAFSVLGSDPTDIRTRLLQQFFAAFLNTLKGADASAIQEPLTQASAWISAHPPAQPLSESDRQLGEALAADLEAYNIGQTGPGHCMDEPRPPTPTPTLSPTITATSTATSGGPVFIPSATPTRTDKPGGGGSGPNPTSPPEPTSPPPTNPPTKPPPPPTEPPTQPPPPTLAPTAPPSTPVPTEVPDSPLLPLPLPIFP